MLCRGIVLLLSMNNKFIALSRIITILSTWLERITWQHFILVEFLLFLQHEHEVAEQETLFWKSNIKSTGIIAEEESQEQAVTVFVIKGSKSC